MRISRAASGNEKRVECNAGKAAPEGRNMITRETENVKRNYGGKCSASFAVGGGEACVTAAVTEVLHGL